MTAAETAAPNTNAPDGLFDGSLKLFQPTGGHRVGADAVLLAAAAPRIPHGLIVDVGAGVGAVGLALAQWNPGAQCALLELNPAAAALSRANIAFNGLTARARAVEADLFDVEARRAAGLIEAGDLVVSNPPFYDPGAVRASPNSDRAMAHLLGPGGLERWLRACLALLRPNGVFVTIHRADSLGELLAALSGRLGAIEILPIFPRAGLAASRVALRGKKGSKAPLALHCGLVLHEADGRFTPQAEAVHRLGARIFPQDQR